MIHLRTLDRKGLEEFVSSGDFEKYGFLPITKHRALSQIKNPKADDDQTLLFLAFDDEKLAGYLGCFPDHFKIEGKIFRYAWLSTLYVSDEFRGKRIAQTLLNKAFEDYKGNIAITEFTKEAESLYQKTEMFEYILPKIGKRYYFRSDLATLIPLKKPSAKSFKPIFSVLDLVVNSFISVKNSFTKKPDFRFEILKKIDSESVPFIAKFQSNRNAEEINWLIENPWVLEGKTEVENYLFSGFAKQFEYFWIKIYNENDTLITCALLLLRNGHLKIPYLFSSADTDKLVRFLNDFIIKNKVKTLTSYHTDLNQKIDSAKNFRKMYQKNFERRYLFHKELIHHLPQHFTPDYQDGDGDCAMT
ncbi:GNAT family N-acetyltransferase [Chryseobacterium sp. GMJ5]|uniref:GNAT family N-acetyltransferase n=1 Tax=Chryseobacterium gilvum TaxID=2976534 RepID=A0ABT2VW17_9FLAO|nr:GNAT family N-acetyltransferase [Chryseobacterium gilvum]MCU7613082.1 GNAT family N-acetyltransferase [Chryseobacterium gilvum]